MTRDRRPDGMALAPRGLASLHETREMINMLGIVPAEPTPHRPPRGRCRAGSPSMTSWKMPSAPRRTGHGTRLVPVHHEWAHDAHPLAPAADPCRDRRLPAGSPWRSPIGSVFPGPGSQLEIPVASSLIF